MNGSGVLSALREFRPFSELGEDDLMIVAARATIERLARGAVLFELGAQDHWIYCIVSGTVSLEPQDGRAHRIDAGTARAGQPLGQLKPRQYTARALTSVEVVRIDGSGLGEITADSTQQPYLVEEMLCADEARSDRAAIYTTQLGDRALGLPSLPSVALETSRLIDRDEADASAVARIVMRDPAITAKLVRAASSPLFYGREPVETCERAVVRLGLRTTRQLVLAFAMRDLFHTERPELGRRMEALWAHSTEVAALASVLARRLGGFDPDEAQLAGLIHDIGVVPVLGYAAEHAELMADPEAVDFLQSDLKADIGERLLRSWNFPDKFVLAARDAEQWWRGGDGEQPDLGDLVVVAQLMSFLGKSMQSDTPPLIRLPAFARVSQGRIDPGSTLSFLDEAAEQVAELKAILR